MAVLNREHRKYRTREHSFKMQEANAVQWISIGRINVYKQDCPLDALFKALSYHYSLRVIIFIIVKIVRVAKCLSKCLVIIIVCLIILIKCCYSVPITITIFVVIIKLIISIFYITDCFYYEFISLLLS